MDGKENAELMSLPNDLKSARVQLLGLTRNKEDLLRDVEKQKMALKGAVASETNGDGKPKYPNSDARTAELDRRCRESAEFNKWDLEIHQLEASIEG